MAQTYTQAAQFGDGPGHDCKHCGRPGFAHDRERVHTESGRYHYELRCP